MGNRCNNCSKMVSLENGEPQVENIEANFAPTHGDPYFDLSASVTGTRVCADCSDELKTLSMDMEGTLELKDIEGFQKLGADKQVAVVSALKDGTADVSIEGSGGDVNESGGGRYAKNMIETTIDYTLEITVPAGEGDDDDIRLEHNGNLSSQNAASEFEDNY